MPLDPRAKRLLDMVALGAPADAGAVTATERRRSFAALMALSRHQVPVACVTDGRLAGATGPLPIRTYRPDAASGTLVFFHGGGLVAGDLDTHDTLCRHLAAKGGCQVIAVDYRLAPDHPFPAAVEDAQAALAAVAAEAGTLGVDANRLAVGGDSGGATLAILAATAARDRGDPRPRFQLLLCPVLDLSHRRPSRLAYETGYLLDQTTMGRDLLDYLPAGVTPADPRVSPILAERLEGLPPTLIHTAEYDPLRDEGADYAARLRAAGISVRHTDHAGMVHHFLALDRLIPAAGPALEAVGQEMREAFAEAPKS